MIAATAGPVVHLCSYWATHYRVERGWGAGPPGGDRPGSIPGDRWRLGLAGNAGRAGTNGPYGAGVPKFGGSLAGRG